MKKKRNFITFIIIEVFLVSFLILVFITPLMNRNLSFKSFYNKNEKELTDLILEKINDNQVIKLEDRFIELENLREGLNQLDNYLKENDITEIKLVNCNSKSFISKDKKTRNTYFQYSIKFLDAKFGLLNIELYTVNSDIKIGTIRLQPLVKSIEELNSFYGSKIDLVRIIILLVGTAIVVLIIYTEYDYFKNVRNNKIWLQILLPISFLGIEFNWNTLETNIELFTIQLFPISSFSPGNAGVWQYTISFPIVLLFYWIKLRKKYINNENFENYIEENTEINNI